MFNLHGNLETKILKLKVSSSSTPDLLNFVVLVKEMFPSLQGLELEMGSHKNVSFEVIFLTLALNVVVSFRLLPCAM